MRLRERAGHSDPPPQTGLSERPNSEFANLPEWAVAHRCYRVHCPLKVATVRSGSGWLRDRRHGNSLEVGLFRGRRRVSIGTVNLAVLLASPLKDAQLCP